MMKIAITTSTFAVANKAPLTRLEGLGVECAMNPWGCRLTKNQAIEFLSDADGVIAGLEPLDAEVLAAAKNLKAIARVGIGVSNIDFDAAEKHRIKVSNTPGGPTEAVAEMTMAAALAMLRDLVSKNDAVHNGEWPKIVVTGLSGLPVLFVGLGRIGTRTAELFKTLGAVVHYYDPYLDPAEAPEWAQRVESLDVGLRNVRLVTIHCSGEEQIIGSKQLDMMQNGAFLLNSARGALVDEQAVCAALESKKLAGVWMDAFAEEPYFGPLTQHSNALLTPHASTYTEQCRLSMEGEAVENIIRDLEL